MQVLLFVVEVFWLHASRVLVRRTDAAFRAFGYWTAIRVQAEVDLTGAEDDACSQLLNGLIESEFNGAMVLYPAHLRPGGLFTGKHGLPHEFCCRVAQDFREMRI